MERDYKKEARDMFREKVEKYVLWKKKQWFLIYKNYARSRVYWSRYVKISSFRITKNQNMKLESVKYINY